MATKKVKLSEARKQKGKSNTELLKKLSDKELHERALSDPDNPPMTKEQMKQFKHVGRSHEKSKG